MEKHIKERLVGAIVLVAIVVIVVPELLTGPRDRAPVVSPPEVAAPVRTVTIDLATGAQRDASAADRVGGAPSPTIAQHAAAPPPAAEAPSTAAPPAAPLAAPRAAPGAASEAPTPVPGTAAAPSAVKPETRPLATEPAATAATAPRPDTAKPTTPPELVAPPRPAAPSATGAEGWVVQLGSFASRPNAERLAAELRAQGYAGFVSEFRGSGRVLYRVRVGPEQDRGRAEAIAERLAREGKKGTVVPHP
jgi:DedD protein